MVTRDVDNVNIGPGSGRYDAVVTGYHHGNLREALVQTAVALGREKGPEGIVIREVARRTGVSHNAAYRHFADRDALLAAIADDGIRMLELTMRRRLAEVDEADPGRRALARLRAAGRAYVEFALAEPGIFEVTFDGCEIHDEDRYLPPLESAFLVLNEILDECAEAGVVDPAKRDGAEVLAWAAVHGFAVLHQRGPLRRSQPADREAALEKMLDMIAAGIA